VVCEVNVAGGTVRCCRGCAVRRSWGLRSWLERGISSAPAGSYVAFLTVTEGSDPREAREHFAAVSRFLEDLWLLLGGKRQYAGVRELQMKRRARTGQDVWHTHLVVLDWARVDLEAVRALLLRHGLGRIFNVKVSKVGAGDDGRSLARYLAKSLSGYMTKGADEDLWAAAMDALPVGCRLHLSSRSWAGGVTLGQHEREHKAFRMAFRALGSAHVLPVHVGSPEEVESGALAAAALLGAVCVGHELHGASLPPVPLLPAAVAGHLF
jgi:hypothetical protein